MSVTVKNVMRGSGGFLWRESEEDGSHILKRTAFLYVDYERDGKKFTAKVRFCGEATDGRGFRCDGLSVPKVFRWFLPSWDAKNWAYNIAGAFHDWLYCTGGAYGQFTREECDDFFRGILRCSGISRFKAGCADKAIEWFAGNSRHWRNDEFLTAPLVHMEVLPCLP